jgi:hypothetical protein
MKTSFKEIADQLREITIREEAFLTSLSDDTVTGRRNGQGRNAKEILGHLIDSASNNHQRMVRLQYCEELLFPDYTRQNDQWIAIQRYGEAPWEELVALWKHYNLHMARVIGSADPAKGENFWRDSEGEKITLRYMTEIYLYHLEMHIGEIHELAVVK